MWQQRNPESAWLGCEPAAPSPGRPLWGEDGQVGGCGDGCGGARGDGGGGEVTPALLTCHNATEHLVGKVSEDKDPREPHGQQQQRVGAEGDQLQHKAGRGELGERIPQQPELRSPSSPAERALRCISFSPKNAFYGLWECPSSHLLECRDANAVSAVTSGHSAAPVIMQWPEGLPAKHEMLKRGKEPCKPQKPAGAELWGASEKKPSAESIPTTRRLPCGLSWPQSCASPPRSLLLTSQLCCQPLAAPSRQHWDPRAALPTSALPGRKAGPRVFPHRAKEEMYLCRTDGELMQEMLSPVPAWQEGLSASCLR